jgi:hypothetical protein
LYCVLWQMQVKEGQACVHLIPMAFPALCKLSLESAKLQDGALFDMFACQPSCMLTCLQLKDCSIKSYTIGNAAHSVARLPHLRSLALEGSGVPIETAAQLTSLTNLIIYNHNNTTDVEKIFRLAGQNKGLQRLELSGKAPPLQAGHLLTLFSDCMSLTQLNVSAAEIDGQALDVLLTHSTRVTDLTLGAINLDSSRAHRQCSWRKLSLLDLHDELLMQLAHLPLRTVQDLNYWGFRSGWGCFNLPGPAAVPAAQLPSLLHEAATNLATCPAWIHAPPSKLSLWGGGQQLTADQRVQLFHALAPLAAPHVTEMRLNLDGQLQLSSAEIQALADSIGSDPPKLSLHNCSLSGTFWKALANHFPQLSSLDLCEGVRASANDIAAYLSMCSSSARQATGMRLKAHPDILDAESQLRLQEHINHWQLHLHNITCEVVDPDDY